MSNTLREAKSLYDLGFAIIWLHAKSKRPVESGWTTGERKSWAYLKSTYQKGMNVGVRTGSPSKIGEYYLACIDVDIIDPKYRNDAEACLKKLIGRNVLPEVSSGGGHGSRHLYCVTTSPFKMLTIAKEKDKWEICVYSDGRQMVMPPSIHPDTGRAYKWTREITSMPLMDFTKSIVATPAEKSKAAPVDFDFEVETVDLDDVRISEKVRDGIVKGTGVTDRSGYLLRASSALVSAGLTQNQVLTILTDKETFLGACGYEHAKTEDRARAAYWIYRYTLERVQKERSAVHVFEGVEIEEARKLSPDEVVKQSEEFAALRSWEEDLDRTPKSFAIKNTLKNAKLILTNVFGDDCIRFNEFANTEELWGEFPWIIKPGKELHDIDVTMLKDWVIKNWQFEPTNEKLMAALSVIAFENSYHPVKRWIKALPQWDETERIDDLLRTYIPCEGDSELRAVVGRRFMVALIKRIFEPGCQADHLLVLEGLQGIYKSSAFRALVGDEWFSDASFNVEDKDAVMVIFSKWLIEFGELSTLDRATAEHTKAFITRRTDRIRAPFDKKARDYPRQCLFVGSTNKDEYLKDDTGNRRYWPFKVTSNCLVEKIARDRTQMFAEALCYYELGEVTYLKEEHLKAKMVQAQTSREMHDLLTDQIANVIAGMERTKGGPLESFYIIDLFNTGRLVGIKLDQYSNQRVATALKNLGYIGKKGTTRDTRARVWTKIPVYMNGHGPKQDAHHSGSSIETEENFDADFH